MMPDVRRSGYPREVARERKGLASRRAPSAFPARSDASWIFWRILLACGVTRAGGRSNLALDAGGAAYAWGDNGLNQLGDGNSAVDGPNPNRLSPGVVSGGQTFTAIDCAVYHTVALTPAGAASGRGHNPFGNLGDGTVAQRNTPVVALGGLTFK